MGSTMTDWVKPGGYADIVAAMVDDAVEAGVAPELVFWMHGETDSMIGTSGQNYEEGLRGVIATIGAGARRDSKQLARPWIVARMTRCYSPMKTAEEVRAAQAAVVDPHYWIYSGPDLDRVGNEFRADGCHFNNAGRAHVSDLLLEAIREALSRTRRIDETTRRPGDWASIP